MRTFFCLLMSTFIVFSIDAKTIKSRYFTINFYGNVDLIEFNKRIDINLFDLNNISKEFKDLNSLIAENIDNLYLEVCRILDIHIYSYRGTINVFNDRDGFNNTIYSLGINNPNLSSIFLPDKNTIYIIEDESILKILAHEIAHAIICNYFITPPPQKVSEILAGYVEYSIIKKLKNK